MALSAQNGNSNSCIGGLLQLSKVPKVALAIGILVILGIVLSAQVLVRQEEKKNGQEILDKGTYLVSLVSLYPLKDFAPDKRTFFLRTLAEYTSYQGFMYLFIHGEGGGALISIASPEISSAIPETVRARSIYTTTLLRQSYRPQGASYTVHEFAKPIFEGGRKAGIVRLGLKLPTVTIFSTERVRLLAMIAFFILAALFVAYYGMWVTLRSLKATYARTVRSGCDGGLQGQVPPNGEKVIPILKELEDSFTSTNKVLNEVREENIRLTSKLGVIGFEKHQFVNVLDSLNFGIIVVDLQHHVTFINEYMLNIINDKREHVVNKGLDRVFSQKEIVEHISGNEMAGSSQGTDSLETTFPDYAPKEVFHISVSPLTAGERTTIGKMISVKNVTGTNMAKRAQEEFIAHVAHELGTSLTNIRAYSEMLMDGEVENGETQKEFYNTINEETKRLSGIIQNLLNISKMEMGNLTLNKGLLRTDWLINDCLSTIEASAQSKQITIDTHVPDILPSFMADKELLKTAIINILGNAVKYTPEQGKIAFSMEERDSAVVFDVEDTGYGMSEEDLPHVFEKFYRSGNPQVAGVAGTGLGLAIAYEIVHLHDGDIEVQSRLGEGSRFTIKIPKEEYILGKS